MNVQLIAAGSLAVLAAAIHGGAGEVLVVRRLSPETLSASAFGGPRMTRAMIHVTWHVTTIAFLAVGMANLGVVGWQLLTFGRLMHRVIEAVAGQARLMPAEPIGAGARPIGQLRAV